MATAVVTPNDRTALPALVVDAGAEWTVIVDAAGDPRTETHWLDEVLDLEEPTEPIDAARHRRFPSFGRDHMPAGVFRRDFHAAEPIVQPRQRHALLGRNVHEPHDAGAILARIGID